MTPGCLALIALASLQWPVLGAALSWSSLAAVPIFGWRRPGWVPAFVAVAVAAGAGTALGVCGMAVETVRAWRVGR